MVNIDQEGLVEGPYVWVQDSTCSHFFHVLRKGDFLRVCYNRFYFCQTLSSDMLLHASLDLSLKSVSVHSRGLFADAACRSERKSKKHSRQRAIKTVLGATVV